MASNASAQNDSASKFNGSASRLSDSASRGLRDSSSEISDSRGAGITNGVSYSGPVTVRIYNENKDCGREVFDKSDKCEFVCLSLAKKLGITPAMLSCFGLGMFDASKRKYKWLASCQKPSEVCCNMSQMQENEMYFRMRVLPEQSKCVQLDEVDPKCLEYLTWQVKWDFLHSYLSCFTEESKMELKMREFKPTRICPFYSLNEISCQRI